MENYLKLQPFVQAPDCTHFNKGTEAKKKLKQQVTLFAKNLDKIDRQKYIRDLKNNGDSPNRLSETNKPALEQLSKRPITINTTMCNLKKYNKTRELSNAHVYHESNGKRVKEKTLVDREFSEYRLFGIPYQSVKVSVEDSKKNNKKHFLKRCEYFALEDEDIKDSLKNTPKGKWGTGAWNLDVPQTQKDQKTHLHGCARPVYGGLNYSNSIKGAAPHYGGVVLELFSKVKYRSTFTVGDSFDLVPAISSKSPIQPPLATIENMDLLYIASCEMPTMLSSQSGSYIEAQIFGGVSFNKDIQSIRIPKKDIKGMSYEEFCIIQNKWDPNQNINWMTYDEDSCDSISKHYKQGLFRYYGQLSEISG